MEEPPFFFNSMDIAHSTLWQYRSRIAHSTLWQYRSDVFASRHCSQHALVIADLTLLIAHSGSTDLTFLPSRHCSQHALVIADLALLTAHSGSTDLTLTQHSLSGSSGASWVLALKTTSSDTVSSCVRARKDAQPHLSARPEGTLLPAWQRPHLLPRSLPGCSREHCNQEQQE